jgi:SAM-dependent methyltransferase
MRSRFPETQVHYVCAEFARPMDLPALDGIVMANSLHFHRKKAPIIEALRRLLKPGGRLLVVEYNTDRGNAWVPYPITFEDWGTLAARCGFAATRNIGARSSRFLGEIYAESISPAKAHMELG